MSGMSGIIYMDCTETVTSYMNTGIQRNVVNIMQRTKVLRAEHALVVIPVVSLNGRFYKYNYTNRRKKVARLLSRIFNNGRNFVDRLFEKKQGRTPSAPGNNVRISAGPSHTGIIEICRAIMPFFFFTAHVLDRSLLEYRPITVNSDDIIFFADSFWNTETRKTIAAYGDATKILLLYDIIPIHRPELCDDVHVATFTRNFEEVVEHVAGIITISCSEKDSVQAFLAAQGKKDPAMLLDYYYLGGDFAPVHQVTAKIRDEVRRAMSTHSTFLMVGTVEPRKNHAFVLDAFEELWRRGEDVSLCIVGKPGWKCYDLLQRIRSHTHLGSGLYYFQDANDQELAYCYEHCTAVVFASVAEGFGLPLVEAMSYGRNVLASDIPVFREIGGDYPIYFPLDDVNALERCLHEYSQGGYEQRPPRQWLSWDETVLSLFGKIVRMAAESKQRRDMHSVLQ